MGSAVYFWSFSSSALSPSPYSSSLLALGNNPPYFFTGGIPLPEKLNMLWVVPKTEPDGLALESDLAKIEADGPLFAKRFVFEKIPSFFWL